MDEFIQQRISDIAVDLEELKRWYIQEETKYQQLISTLTSLQDQVKVTKKTLENLDIVRTLLEKTSFMAREKARLLLQETTTTVLQYVFGNSISCSIVLDKKQNKPSADIFINTETDNGIVKREPQSSCGGGIVDIVSIALRIAYKRLLNINGPLILDEPGKHVSKEYSVKLAQFLQYISKELNTQIIFVTHNEELSAISDKAYETINTRGESQTQRLATK